jgi:hypothetical protein
MNGSIGAQLAALGLQGPGHLPTLPALFGSTLAVTTWMAFMLFRNRRRDDEPPRPDAFLQAAAATGLAVEPGSGYVPMVDPESLMPRWRRPSLIEARKMDPIRAPAPERRALSFAHGAVDDQPGSERRLVRYAVIPLLDRPDEILAARLGELAEGDEVQVQGRHGAYCEVLCPDGRRGWVHRTTLGDPVVAPSPWSDRVPDTADDGENALAALLAARGLR